MIKKILAAAAFGAVAMGAQASTNVVTDGNFESTGAAFGGSSYCYAGDVGGPQCGSVQAGWAINGWKGLDPAFLQSDSGPWGTPNGLANGGTALGGFVAAVQSSASLVSTSTFVAGQEYLLTWSAAGRTNNGGVQKYDVSVGSFNGTFTTNPSNGWTTYSEYFKAGADSTLIFQGLTNTDQTAFIDNISVTAVPEPASLLMMASARWALLAYRRRSQI